MSKTDRKKRLKARKREIAEAVRKGDILALTPKRKPSGRRKEPKEGWGQAGPTPEAAARRATLLPTGRGSTDCWIDVAEATGLLPARLAEALRRYRGWIRAFAKMSGAPSIWAHGGVTGGITESDEEAVEYRRLLSAIESASDAMRAAHWRDADTVEACIRGPAMPTSAQMERIRRASLPLADALGI